MVNVKPTQKETDKDKFKEEPLQEEIGSKQVSELPTDERLIRGAQEYLDIAYHYSQIDFTNRKIRMVPAVSIATNSKKFLKLSSDFKPSGVLDADGDVTTIAGTTSGTLGSYTVPLNTISRNDPVHDNGGNVFRVTAWGVMTTDDASATVTLSLRMNSTVYHAIVSTGATVTNAPWRIDWNMIVTLLGTGGAIESYASAKINNVNKDSGSTALKNIDTTEDNDINITAAWTSGSAGDSISIRGWILELIN